MVCTEGCKLHPCFIDFDVALFLSGVLFTCFTLVVLKAPREREAWMREYVVERRRYGRREGDLSFVLCARRLLDPKVEKGHLLGQNVRAPETA